MAIARAAAALVEPGMAVAVSAGSTTYEVSRRLADVPRLTVVTNSVPAAEVLYHGGRSDQTIILSGGVRTPSDALVGPFAVNALRNVNVDIVFLGVHGMHERAGFTTPNLLEAETDQALIETGWPARRHGRPHEVGRGGRQHHRAAGARGRGRLRCPSRQRGPGASSGTRSESSSLAGPEEGFEAPSDQRSRVVLGA